MTETLVTGAVTTLGLMLVTWMISLPIRDASIVDMVWGLGFALVAWAGVARIGASPVGLVVAVMVTLWGVRLSGYLAWRNLGKPEDFRYRAMRARRPGAFWFTSLFTVFLLQAGMMWVVALPVMATIAQGGEVTWGAWFGVALWTVGIFFETMGDAQMARFKAQPGSEGKVLDRGLWRYTRHPNYFGDFCVWWGLFLVGVAAGQWWTVVSPILMSLLLLRVSGVALLEKDMTGRRPDYAEYVARTNAFFPGPRR